MGNAHIQCAQANRRQYIEKPLEMNEVEMDEGNIVKGEHFMGKWFCRFLRYYA